MKLEDFAELVPSALRQRSGAVFYSGRAAFESQSDLYILGLNPGGNPSRQAAETVQANIDASLQRAASDWSAYVDDSWNGKRPGSWKMQPRIRHLLARLQRDPRRTPASNVVFTRSAREADLLHEKQALLEACWPLHRTVIQALNVKVVICLGRTAGRWVRDATGAQKVQENFREDNARGWISQAHSNESGLQVVTLTHPSIAAWKVEATDPTSLVRSALSRAGISGP